MLIEHPLGQEKPFPARGVAAGDAAWVRVLAAGFGLLMPPPPPRKASNMPLVFGLVGFTSLMAAVPLLLHRRHMRLQQGVPMVATERALSTTEVRRGVYLNTGSKDVGADPDWDFKAGTYKGKKPAIIDETTGLAPAGSRSMRAGS